MKAGNQATRQLNRAEVVDARFRQSLEALEAAPPERQSGGPFSDRDLLEMFDSQMLSRQIDHMARIKRLENKVFYTIGSSGHEGNALIGRLTRHTDPAFLHYRSGAFMAERYRKLPELDFLTDTCLSFAASSQDPASGGRHKVWGSKPLWVLPQTSTIASHLPKALGTALAIAQATRLGHELPIPEDSIAVCSFGDASVNHATAQAAFNSCAWTRHQGLPVPILFVCEDNGIGISVPTPAGWIAESMKARPGIEYRHADGLDLAAGYEAVADAVQFCRQRRRPVFLHLDTTRLMGHAGTDFEIEYRSPEELEAAEGSDPLVRSARRVVARGLMTPGEIRDRYDELGNLCLESADRADATPRLVSAESVMAPLAPVDREAVHARAADAATPDRRLESFGGEKALPERADRKHMAIQINRGLVDLMAQYPEALLFGEDVARKGGVYTVTKGLMKRFGRARVFNTLLDETTILGLAQGYANMGFLPIPEIQYLAYFHNACDQVRGEACSQQFFSNNQFANPMVIRVAALGYQKGFGGHFHNDNSIAALRDIPGLVVGCPSRGDDAVGMLRTMTALARESGRVSVFLEPIALYMAKDLFKPDDGGWCFSYPAPGEYLPLWDPRVYFSDAADLLIVTFGNGVPMALRVARKLQEAGKGAARVLDLRWIKPLNRQAVIEHAGDCARVLVVDEGRPDGGVGEGVIGALVESGLANRPIRRVTGRDCYIPLGAAANLVLPQEEEILTAATELLESG